MPPAGDFRRRPACRFLPIAACCCRRRRYATAALMLPFACFRDELDATPPPFIRAMPPSCLAARAAIRHFADTPLSPRLHAFDAIAISLAPPPSAAVSPPPCCRCLIFAYCLLFLLACCFRRISAAFAAIYARLPAAFADFAPYLIDSSPVFFFRAITIRRLMPHFSLADVMPPIFHAPARRYHAGAADAITPSQLPFFAAASCR